MLDVERRSAFTVVLRRFAVSKIREVGRRRISSQPRLETTPRSMSRHVTLRRTSSAIETNWPSTGVSAMSQSRRESSRASPLWLIRSPVDGPRDLFPGSNGGHTRTPFVSKHPRTRHCFGSLAAAEFHVGGSRAHGGIDRGVWRGLVAACSRLAFDVASRAPPTDCLEHGDQGLDLHPSCDGGQVRHCHNVETAIEHAVRASAGCNRLAPGHQSPSSSAECHRIETPSEDVSRQRGIDVWR